MLNAAAFPGAYTMLPLSAVELKMIKNINNMHTFELLKRVRMLRARQDTRAYMGHWTFLSLNFRDRLWWCWKILLTFGLFAITICFFFFFFLFCFAFVIVFFFVFFCFFPVLFVFVFSFAFFNSCEYSPVIHGKHDYYFPINKLRLHNTPNASHSMLTSGCPSDFHHVQTTACTHPVVHRMHTSSGPPDAAHPVVHRMRHIRWTTSGTFPDAWGCDIRWSTGGQLVDHRMWRSLVYTPCALRVIQTQLTHNYTRSSRSYPTHNTSYF